MKPKKEEMKEGNKDKMKKINIMGMLLVGVFIVLFSVFFLGFEKSEYKTLDLSEYELKGNSYCQPIKEGQGNWTICYDIRDVILMKEQGKYNEIILPMEY